MKQITVFFVVFFFWGINIFAQNEAEFKALKDKVAKSNVAITDAKKGSNIKTWLDRGKLFHDAYNVNVAFLRYGLPASDAVIFFKEPLNISNDEEGNEVYEYKYLKLTFENGFLKNWIETEKVAENALDEAIASFQKAREMDVKGKNEKKIIDAITMINRDYESMFFNEYYLSDFVGAYNTALKRIEISDYLNITDTTYYFFAGFSAFTQSEIDSSMWRQSVDYLEKAFALGYREIGEGKGQIYDLLSNSYKKIGEPEIALKYAQTGFEKYPGYTPLIYTLINHYIGNAENELALQYLQEAVSRDPTNQMLLFAQGKVLDELGEKEKSVASYDAAIAIDPNFYDAYFNKAVVFYNWAVKLNDLGIAAKTNAEYERYKNLSDDEFYLAIEPMEKAYSLKPDEMATMTTLKSLYLRLRIKYPELEEKFNFMDEKIKAIEGQ